MARVKVVAAVIRKNGKILLTSRPADKPPYGLEFPGGKVEAGESIQRALCRELQEELSLAAIPADVIYRTINGKYIICFIRTWIADEAKISPQESQQYFWLDENDPAIKEQLLASDRRFWEFLHPQYNF